MHERGEFIPLLERWELIDYQKVKLAIREVMANLRSQDHSELILEGAPNEDVSLELIRHPRGTELLKCWECGERFEWTVEEQGNFRTRGWEPPKRCSSCREERRRRREKLGWSDLDW